MEETNKLPNPFVYIKGVPGRGKEVIEELVKRGGKNIYPAGCVGNVDTLFYYIGIDMEIHNTRTIPDVLKGIYKEIFLPEEDPFGELRKDIEALFERNKITDAQIVELSKDKLVLAHKEEPFPRVHALAFMYIDRIFRLVVKPDFSEFPKARNGYIPRLFKLADEIFSNRVILGHLEFLFSQYRDSIKYDNNTTAL